MDDVTVFCDGLINEGVYFQKKPSDGNMKDIAFVLDPDNYWIEVLPRSKAFPATEVAGKPSFSQNDVQN